MSLLANLAVRLSGFETAQNFILRSVEELQALAGVGSGAQPATSGESSVARLLRKQQASERPAVIFDVGANDGGFATMICDELKERPFSMHCFEPGRAAFLRLSDKFGGRRDFQLNHFGLGAECGEKILYYGVEGSPLASLTERRLDHFRRRGDEVMKAASEVVDIVTLDSYLGRSGIKEIDLLKIDVEGHELDVLHGAREALGRGAIGSLVFEFGGCNIDSRTFFQDYWYFFAQFPSAKIFRLTPSGYLLRIWKYRESLEVFRAANYLVQF
jgi:FkbM family methyltransferase